MFELMSLSYRGRLFIEGYGRLAREYHCCCLHRIGILKNVNKTLPALSNSVFHIKTRTISQILFSISSKNFSNSIFLSAAKVWTSSEAADLDATKENPDSLSKDETSEESFAQASLLLQKILKINAGQADLCVAQNHDFVRIALADISRNYRACIKAGFSKKIINNNPWILASPWKVFDQKLQSIVNMNLNVIDDSIPFFQLDVSKLRSFSINLKHETTENNGVNRIIYLAEQLRCPTITICKVLTKYYFMRTGALGKIKTVVKILQDFKVTKDDILNDVWAFRYTPDQIFERLKRATEAGVHPIKPWMIRCPEGVLSRSMKKAKSRLSVLGDTGTVAEYLAERFGCDKEVIDAMITKHPPILHVSAPKLEEVVDFLLENGYRIDDVCRIPRVLCHSIAKMRIRITELEKYGHRPKRLNVFCHSALQYNSYLKSHGLAPLGDEKKREDGS